MNVSKSKVLAVSTNTAIVMDVIFNRKTMEQNECFRYLGPNVRKTKRNG